MEKNAIKDKSLGRVKGAYSALPHLPQNIFSKGHVPTCKLKPNPSTPWMYNSSIIHPWSTPTSRRVSCLTSHKYGQSRAPWMIGGRKSEISTGKSTFSGTQHMSCAAAMDRVQSNRVSEWYMFILLIQPQSNSFYPDAVIYLDRFFCACFFERWQAWMKTSRNKIGVTRLFLKCKE